MSIALRRIRDRVRIRTREFDARKAARSTPEIDQCICDAYLALQASLPAPDLYTANAFTISANSETFTLPATVTQWTGNDGGAEYQGEVRIQLVSTGQYLTIVTPEQLDSWRNGHETPVYSIPRFASLHEDKTQGVNGRCYPGAKDEQACNLWARLSADDLRNFIGSGSDDLDDVEVQFSRIGSLALVLRASAELVAGMTAKDLELRGLSADTAKLWMSQADVLAYNEATRRHDLDQSGRIQRWIS